MATAAECDEFALKLTSDRTPGSVNNLYQAAQAGYKIHLKATKLPDASTLASTCATTDATSTTNSDTTRPALRPRVQHPQGQSARDGDNVRSHLFA
eukprot:276196-Pleurochrysis_carterae.AAC.1